MSFLFSILQLYQIHWWPQVVLVASLGFSVYRIKSSADTDSFLSFLFGLLYFFFLLWLPWLGLPKLCGIIMVKSGHPCLISDLRENAFSFSLLRTMLAVGLSYMAFIMLNIFPLCPLSREFFFFNHKWVLNFVYIY